MYIKELIKKWEKLLEEYKYEEEQVRGDIEEFIKDLEECEEKGSCDMSGLDFD